MKFLKFLVPFLFLSSVAFAEDAKPVDSPTPPVKSSKCQTNVDETIKGLVDNGYMLLMKFWDTGKPYISRHILYNDQHNDIAVISFVYDKDKFKQSDEDAKPVKICTEFQGGNTQANGEGFRKFFLAQIIQDRQNDLDKNEEAKKKHLEEEHDPYQGNPWSAVLK